MKGQRFFAVACASAMLLVSASAFAQLTDDERKCSDAFNKAARNVANQEQKNNRKACVKEGGGEACVAATSAKAADKLAKLNELDDVGGKCETLPAFGVNFAGANTAVTLGTDTIIRDIFGDPVDGVVAGDKCQDSVAKRSGKIYDTILKAFRKCTKDAGALNSIADFNTCVTTAANDAKVATFAGKLTNDATNKCDTLPIPGGEDGECSTAATPGDLSACAVARTKCNACTAINAYTGGSANCDLVDDGAGNGSCGQICGNGTVEGTEECDPPLTGTCGGGQVCISDCSCQDLVHKCTFDGATDNSALQLCFLGTCIAPFDTSGALDITCDPTTEDGNGKRDCQCDLQVFNPVNIPGVGIACIDPFGPCPDGELDCNGGNSLDIDSESATDTGSICTGNADCASDCATYCGGLSKVVYNSGCESFCQGGSRDDLPCICDVATGATCAGGIAGVNDCPGGSCEGKDNEADNDCHCACIDEASGPASPAGTLQCRLGVAIRVESSLPCDNVGVIVRLPGQCAPFTTTTATNIITDTNENAGTDLGPYSETGIATSCPVLDVSNTGGMELVSVLAFYDSTIGDIVSRLRADCQ